MNIYPPAGRCRVRAGPTTRTGTGGAYVVLSSRSASRRVPVPYRRPAFLRCPRYLDDSHFTAPYYHTNLPFLVYASAFCCAARSPLPLLNRD